MAAAQRHRVEGEKTPIELEIGEVQQMVSVFKEAFPGGRTRLGGARRE